MSFEDIKSELDKRLNSNNKSLYHREYVQETLVPILKKYENIVHENIKEIKEENHFLWVGLSRMFKFFALDFKALLVSDGSIIKPVFNKDKYASAAFKGDTAKSWSMNSFKKENPHSSRYAETFFSMIDHMNKAYKYEYPSDEDIISSKKAKFRRINVI